MLTESSIACRALALLETLDDKSDFAVLINHAATLINELESIYLDRGEYLSNEHPICQMLAHRIKNLTCPNPDHSFRRAQIQVTRMAGVDYGDQESSQESISGASSATGTGAGTSLVRETEEYRRVIAARKRLRS